MTKYASLFTGDEKSGNDNEVKEILHYQLLLVLYH